MNSPESFMNDYSNNGSLAKVREFNHSQKNTFILEWDLVWTNGA